jgi:phosphate:Na+ symporter
MGTQQIFENVFLMIGGLAVFMFGMKMMGENLENAAGNKMRSLLGKISSNRFKGVGVGTAVTCIIQSSSATTVMIVGFVNVGMMTLTQAASVIMGANIGTTITAQIVSLQNTSFFNVTALASLLAGIGLTMTLISKKDKYSMLGNIFIGLGMIFIGLSVMSGSMKGFRSLPAFTNLFQVDSVFILLLAGLIFTAIIQSSSAVTGIIITLAASGLINLENSFFIILGSNIGTCVTALLASFGASTNAKRAAMIHLLFNIIGCLIVFVPLVVFKDSIAEFIKNISGNSTTRQIANFHTIFNILTSALLIPFLNQLVKIATKLVPDKKTPVKIQEKRLLYLDERILETPPIAVANVKKEIVSMANMSFKNLERGINILLSGDLSNIPEARKVEENINFLNKEITAFLVKISSREITDNDEKLIGSYYHVVSDIERIGDYAENLLNYSEKMNREDITFSDDAKKDIEDVYAKIVDLYQNTIKAFEFRDISLLKYVTLREDEIDEAKRNMSHAHVERLHKGLCTPESGAIYLSIASNLERIADHMTNIAYSTKIYNAGGTR